VLADLGYAHRGTPHTDVDYAVHHHVEPVHKLGALPIEIHHELAPQRSPFRIDYAGLWERAAVGTVAGVDVPVLAPEDLLLHLCTHVSYNHRFLVPLLAVYDVVAVCRRFTTLDWSVLIGIANRDGRAPFVYATLQLANRLFGLQMPPDVTMLDHSPDDDDAAETARSYVLAAPADVPLGLQAMAERRSAYGRFVAFGRAVFPPRERMRAIYRLGNRSWLPYVYYVWRPLDLLLRRGAEIVGWAAGHPATQAAREREALRRRLHQWAERFHL